MEIVVVHGSEVDVELTCGAARMVPREDPATATGASAAEGEDETLIGKRYVDNQTGAELLCTRSGFGALQIDGRPLELKAAKALPSSD